MTFNPYAPPESNMDDQGAGAPGGTAGAPQEWTIEEVLRIGWDAVKIGWPALIFGPFIAGIIGQVPAQILQQVGRASHDKDVMIGMQVASSLVAFLIQPFFQGGLVRMQLQAARGGNPSIGETFSGGSLYFKLLATNFLLFLAIFGGTLLLIVPGIILALGFSMSQFYVVDANMGPIEAMSASWNAMKGHKLHLFGFGFVAILVAIVGLLACCVGMFAAQAVLYVAVATIFTRVSGRTGAWQPPPGASPYGPPGGYGGAGGGAGAGPVPPPGGGWGAA